MESDFLSKEFPITSVTRADLIAAGLPKNVVKAFSDEQMARIASRMADYYCDGEFWDHAKAATEYVVDRDVPTEGQDESPVPSSTYAVLSLSRLDLSSVGFTNAEINALTDEDMEKIADSLQRGLRSLFRLSVIHVAKLVLSEQDDRTGGQGES